MIALTLWILLTFIAIVAAVGWDSMAGYKTGASGIILMVYAVLSAIILGLHFITNGLIYLIGRILQ
jgi:hypothetical protein